MRWKTLEEELPDCKREIFAKFYNGNAEYVRCYVLGREEAWHMDGSDLYVETLGEGYMSVEPSEIIGWVYVDDLQEMLDRGE